MIFLAFASLGFLIGNLIGLSAESALAVVLPLLFAFGGGSAVAFLHKLADAELKRASLAVTALSLSCLLGAYSGIVVAERQLLSPPSTRAADRGSIEARKYLRTDEIPIGSIELIDQRYKGKEITAAEAYEALRRLTLEAPAQ